MPDGEDPAAYRSIPDVVLDAMNEWLDGSGMVTGFHFIVEWCDTDGEENLGIAVPDGQKYSHTLGLLDMAQIEARRDVKAFLSASFDDPQD